MKNAKTIIDEGELRLFRAVWSGSEDHLFVVLKDANGDYMAERSNPALTQRTQQIQLAEGAISNTYLQDILPTESYKLIKQRYDQCLSTGKPVTYEEEHELHEPGDITYWSTMILPVTDTETGEQRIFGMSREITQLKQLEAQLYEANEKLESEVEARTKELKTALVEMERISNKDKLTQVYNRHKLDQALANVIDMAERYGEHFGVILLDIDNFKFINDCFGHTVGDQALIEFVNELKKTLRKTDTLGRWGGDEFLIILPQTTQDGLMALANAFKAQLTQYQSEIFGSLTSSIGVTLYQANDTISSIITRADSALYTSKNRGKNAVTFK